MQVSSLLEPATCCSQFETKATEHLLVLFLPELAPVLNVKHPLIRKRAGSVYKAHCQAGDAEMENNNRANSMTREPIKSISEIVKRSPLDQTLSKRAMMLIMADYDALLEY